MAIEFKPNERVLRNLYEKQLKPIFEQFNGMPASRSNIELLKTHVDIEFSKLGFDSIMTFETDYYSLIVHQLIFETKEDLTNFLLVYG